MAKAQLIAAIGACIVRLIVCTLRFRIKDEAGLAGRAPEQAVIWVFWHNRMFVMAHLFNRFFPQRRGAALTSASKDGEILAAFLQRFGIRPVRGSSSRRGGVAMREMSRLLADGCDVAVTPDGPRGPRYRLDRGVLKLAQASGAALLPTHVVYSRYWQLNNWDGFMIPKPFAQVEITLTALQRIPHANDDAEFERERVRLETILHAGCAEEAAGKIAPE